jgi:hypothetical protein
MVCNDSNVPRDVSAKTFHDVDLDVCFYANETRYQSFLARQHSPGRCVLELTDRGILFPVLLSYFD